MSILRSVGVQPTSGFTLRSGGGEKQKLQHTLPTCRRQTFVKTLEATCERDHEYKCGHSSNPGRKAEVMGSQEHLFRACLWREDGGGDGGGRRAVLVMTQNNSKRTLQNWGVQASKGNWGIEDSENLTEMSPSSASRLHETAWT